jgi:hypothetical protein
VNEAIELIIILELEAMVPNGKDETHYDPRRDGEEGLSQH